MKKQSFERAEAPKRPSVAELSREASSIRQALKLDGSSPEAVKYDLSRIEQLFRVRQQLEAHVAEGMLGQLQNGRDQMDSIVYDMLNLLKVKYDETPDFTAEDVVRDVEILNTMRNGLTEVFRKIDVVYAKVARGIAERQRLEIAKAELEERKQNEAEQASVWGRIKSVFLPPGPTPIAISGKRGKKVELVRTDDQSQQYLDQLKKRRDDLSELMEEVDEGLKFLRSKAKARAGRSIFTQ